MRIQTYVPQIEHAVSIVIAEIHREREQLDAAERNFKAANAAADDGYRKAEFLNLNPDLDDDFLGTAIYWDTYFGPDKEQHDADAEIARLQDLIRAKSFSMSALAGSLLQYGKQGISLQYGGVDTCPAGRTIEGFPIRDLIWYGRNQALHWDDHNFRGKTAAFLDSLANTKAGPFLDYKTRSLSLDFINLLKWKDIGDFKLDLLSLDP